MDLKETIQDAKRTAPENIIIQNLIQDFEDFSELVSNRNTEENYPEKLNECQRRLSSSFARVAAFYGFSVKQMQEYLENPKNFNPADWEHIQVIKRQIAVNLDLPTDTPKSPKIKNKHLKI